MFFNTNIIKFFSIIVIFVTIATLYPTHEAKAFLGFLDFTFTTETPCPISILNCLTLAQELWDVVLKPLANAIVKAAIRAVVADIKNQTIKWIVTGQFDKPQFVSSFQADPRKIAENASRIFLSRLTGINFCQFNQNIPSSSLLFSAKLKIQLDCTVPGLSGTNGKVETDWFRAGFPTVWGITNPQNNGWDVAGRVVVQKNISEQASLNAFYNEILTNAGVRGFTDSKGKIITPGGYIADALKTTIQNDYPSLNTINENDWTGIIQAIAEIVDAGLKKSIQKGLTTAFK